MWRVVLMVLGDVWVKNGVAGWDCRRGGVRPVESESMEGS